MRRLATLLLCSAAYGFALGSAHSPLYAARNLLKFPLLIALTAGVCALAYWVVARALGAPLGPRAVLRAVLDTFTAIAVLLASLAPAVLFTAVVLARTDDGQLGSYYLFFGANLVLVALSGTLALVQRARSLCTAHGLRAATSARVVVAWIALTLFVGGQASFLLRPFFGLPATRGGAPPWFLGTTADVRGATSFYEMVLLVGRDAPLPAGR